MPLNPLNHHYAMENAVSVYDEEAMTPLELAGRTAAKVNETVNAFNKLEADTDERLDTQDAAIPVKVEKSVDDHIKNGDFDRAIDLYAGVLSARVDNLVQTVTPGSTTGDAELIDLRVGQDGVTYTSAGEAVRTQFDNALKSHQYLPETITNLNDLTGNGCWVVDATNKPDNWPNANGGLIFNIQRFTTLRMQIAMNLYDGKTYYRYCHKTTWGNWQVLTLENGYLPSGAELDDMTESGHWVIPSDHACTRPLSGACELRVYATRNGLISQSLIAWINGATYYRHYTGNKWSLWMMTNPGGNKYTDGDVFGPLALPLYNLYLPEDKRDLDNLSESGVWVIQAGHDIASLPTNKAVILTSYHNQNKLRYQFLFAHDDGVQWYRYYMNNVWTKWMVFNRPIDTDIASSLMGHKICVIGDSITEANYRAHKNWVTLLSNVGADMQNLGDSGTGFAQGATENLNYIKRIPKISADTELIGVALSFNDISTGLSVGTAMDTGTATICGYVNAFFDELLAKYPTIPVCAYVQSPWASYHYGANTVSDSLVSAFEEICKIRGIPFKNLYHSSGLMPWVNANNERYFTAPGYTEPDGVHPNDAGHKLIFRHLLPFFEECLPTTNAM